MKFTLPGPMTIVDGVMNVHYSDPGQLHRDLARCINREVLGLVAHGCTHIQVTRLLVLPVARLLVLSFCAQVDEPVLMRYPEVALEIGFPCLELVLANLPPGVTTTLHLCCGYPDKCLPYLKETHPYKCFPYLKETFSYKCVPYLKETSPDWTLMSI